MSPDEEMEEDFQRQMKSFMKGQGFSSKNPPDHVGGNSLAPGGGMYEILIETASQRSGKAEVDIIQDFVNCDLLVVVHDAGFGGALEVIMPNYEEV